MAFGQIVLSIEHFSETCNNGGSEAVLVLLDRGFALLLESVIIHRVGRIREPRTKETTGLVF